MTNLDKYLAEIEGRVAGRAECSVCLSPVIHHSSDEGTQSYERVVSRTDLETLVKMVRRARGAVEAVCCEQHSHYLRLDRLKQALADLNKLAGEMG